MGLVRVPDSHLCLPTPQGCNCFRLSKVTDMTFGRVGHDIDGLLVPYISHAWNPDGINKGDL